jgi:integrase
MSIKENHQSGKTFYQVYVNLRSEEDPSIRAQRLTKDVASLAEAHETEKRFLKEVQKEVAERERKGASWERVVEGWELAMRKGEGTERPISKDSAENYIQVLQLYTQSWMRMSAKTITRADVRKALADIAAQGKSKSRMTTLITAVNGAFEWGIENRIIKDVDGPPTRGIKHKREEERAPEILTIAQVRKLLDAAKLCEHEWYPIWAGALLTGMRNGELYALEWNDVDFDSKRVMVSKSYNSRHKTIKSTKSGYWREVPINSELEALLKKLKASDPNRNFVFPRLTDWRRSEQARILRAFCQGVGLPSIRFHALRACFATHLIREGVAPAVVMKICGWKDLKVMQRYIRLAGIEIEGATDSLKILSLEEASGKVVELFKA